MKYRRLAALTVVITLVGVSCASSADEAGSATAPTSLAFESAADEGPATAGASEASGDLRDGVVIGVAMQNTSRTFFQGLESGARGKAEATGTELLIRDANDDPDVQLEMVRELLDVGIDGLVLSPVDSGQAVTIAELAAAAGVPLVSVANQIGTVEDYGSQFVYPGTLALVTNDDVDMGRKAAGLVARIVGDRRVGIGVIEGKSGTANAVMRLDGFVDELDALGIGYEIVASFPGDWTAAGGLAVCTEMGEREDIEVVFSMSDAMTEGCAEALVATNRPDIDIVSIGGNIAGVALLKSGAIVGTVCQKPGTMGAMAVELIVNAVSGRDDSGGLRFYETPVVTMENQATACIPQW